MDTPISGSGHVNILHSFLMAVDKQVLEPSDRVQAMLALERHVIEVAKLRNYDAIVTINPSDLTQQADHYVFGYELYQVVDGLHEWRPDPDQDVLFKGATEKDHVNVCYKLLK